MLDVPRSVLLAAWGSAVLLGRAGCADAVRAVTGQDHRHDVEAGEDVGDDASVGRPSDLASLLLAWRGAGVRGLAVRLPVPGDVLGLPGPAAFNRACLQAGECVVTEPPPGEGGLGGRGWGAVPAVVAFGSPWEPGHLVTWRVSWVERRPVSDLGSVAEADQALRLATAEAAAELSGLDVARWRPDAAMQISQIRDGGLPAGALPPGSPPRCVRLLASALRLRAVVELARQDDGAAVSGFEAQRRQEALRRLDGVARRALVAAANGALEPR